MSPQLIVITALSVLGFGLVQPAIGQNPPPSRYIETDQLVIAPVNGSNEFRAFSVTAGAWSTFAFPDDVTATPIMGNTCCTFQQEGGEIHELVAVDLNGNWCVTKLPRAVNKVTPYVSYNLAAFLIDGRAYAFSAETGKWDSIESTVMPTLSKDLALVVEKDWIAAFSVQTGKWSKTETTKRNAKP